jgi:hypothetical protein
VPGNGWVSDIVHYFLAKFMFFPPMQYTGPIRQIQTEKGISATEMGESLAEKL